MDKSALSTVVAAMLERAGLSTEKLGIEPRTGGGNNRVFRVDAGGRAMLAKVYFRHSADTRDRLNSEYAFLEYARNAGIDCVPGVVARDDQAGIALYDYIEGSSLRPESVNGSQVEQAQDFFARLNEATARGHGKSLANASEACFSIVEQLHLVQGRIDRLTGIQGQSRIDADAMTFVAMLRARWATLSQQVLHQSLARGIDPNSPLAEQDRCISPSDFGFHNAILTGSDKVVFIDFEFAGWDDPAKAISDFFCHPAVPVSAEYFDGFLAAAIKYSENASYLSRRTRVLLPVFRIKWCCIVLNEFLPMFQERRFADPAINAEARKQRQLDKARRLLEAVH